MSHSSYSRITIFKVTQPTEAEMWFFFLLLQVMIGLAFSDYSDDLRIHQDNIAKLKCDSPEATSNNSSLSENMLTRLGLVLSDKLKTDGDVKLILLFDMEAAITKCGCGAKHLRFAVFTIVGNGKVAVEKLDAPNSPGTIKFGASTVKGACGATIPIYENKESDGRVSLYTTKTDANQKSIFYAWPIPGEKKLVQVQIATTTRLSNATNIPKTTTKKSSPTARKPSPADNSKLCDPKVGLPLPVALLTYLATRVPGGLNTDGQFKVIRRPYMENAIEKCGCGAKHLRTARFKGNRKVGNLEQGYHAVEHYKRSMEPKDDQTPLDMGVFGISTEIACGASVPIYKHKIGSIVMLSTTKTNASQAPDFYAWP